MGDETRNHNTRETFFSLGQMQDLNSTSIPNAPQNKRPPRPSDGQKSPGQLTPMKSNIPQRRTSNGSSFDHTSERVKVVVRVRPPHANETGGAVSVAPDNKGIVLYRDQSVIPQSGFEFDKVLQEHASQADVFQAAVQPIVQDVMNGYNGTVMAYGQTGAGKTYTLSSIAPDAIGMMPRAAAAIFAEVASDTGHMYTVYMSYIQIYMELLQDLLQPQNNDMQIREGENGVFVAGVHEVEVKSMEDCLHLLQVGDRNRVFAFTALNAHSSRSHAIVMLTIMKRPNNALLGQKVKVGKLFLVDLAGSERLKKSRSTGLRASEAVSINLSLTTLGMCINARADPNATHVPFRDSKLTRLLQESLGGNAKTSLVIAVANAMQHSEETLQSLQFGSRAMRVKTQAVVNEHTDIRVINAELVAALDKRDDKSHLLEATLLAKEEELESLSRGQKEEQARNKKIMEALKAEKNALADEQAKLSTMLSQTKAEAQDMAARHALERSELEAALKQALQALSAAKQDHAAALLEHEQASQRTEQQHRASLDALNAQHTAALQRRDREQQAALRQHREQLLQTQAAHAEELRSREALLVQVQARHKDATQKLQRQHAAELGKCQAQLAQLQAEHEEAAVRMRKEHEQELCRREGDAAALSEWHKAELRTLKSEHTVELEERLTAHQEAQEQHRCALEDAAAQHASQLQRLQQQHALDMEAAASQHFEEKQRLQQRLAEAVSQHETHSTRLKEEHALASKQAGALHARQVQQLEEAHRQELDQVRRQLQEEKNTAALKAEEESESVRQLLHAAEAAAADARNETAQVRQDLQDEARASEERWARQMEEAAAAAKGKLDRQRELNAQYEDTIAELSQDVSGLTASLQALRDDHSGLTALAEAQKAEIEGLQEALQTMKGRLVKEQQRLAGMQRSREAFLAVWQANRSRARAMRTMQRHIQSRTIRRLQRTNQALGHLEGMHMNLAKASQRQLAWSGETSVAQSVKQLEDAVVQIRAAFLLPQKELKTLDGFKKIFGSTGSPMAPLRPRSAMGSPRWAIRAASFSGGNSPFSRGTNPRPFISPSTSPTGTPRRPPSRTSSSLSEPGSNQPQVEKPQLTESPERKRMSDIERAIIARISAQDDLSAGAVDVRPRGASGPLSSGISQAKTSFPPLPPTTLVPAAETTPRKQMLSAEDASFRSPMQYGLSRMPEAQNDVHIRESSLPKLKIQPSATRGIAASVTQRWGR